MHWLGWDFFFFQHFGDQRVEIIKIEEKKEEENILIACQTCGHIQISEHDDDDLSIKEVMIPTIDGPDYHHGEYYLDVKYQRDNGIYEESLLSYIAECSYLFNL